MVHNIYMVIILFCSMGIIFALHSINWTLREMIDVLKDKKYERSEENDNKEM